MDVRLVRTLERQRDLVAGWQLRRLGWTTRMVEDHAWRHGWQVIHPGVYGMSRAPLDDWHRWRAATLSAPDTFLNAASAGASFGFRPWQSAFETVVRAGSGGPRRLGSLLVARSTTLEGQTTVRDGVPIVTAPRALVELAPYLERQQLGRCFRESIRLKTTTANRIAKALAGQRGTAVLVDLCDRYATIPYHRCRSDAESRALEVLRDAGVEAPRVNVRVARCEADLVWRERRLIVEIDGDRFHQFPDEDARKEAAWRGAGYTVRRVPSDDVYYRPHLLLNAANVPLATP